MRSTGFLEDLALHHKKAFAHLLAKAMPVSAFPIGGGAVVPGVQLNILAIESGSYPSAEDIARLSSPSQPQPVEPPFTIDHEPPPCEAPAQEAQGNERKLAELSASIGALASQMGIRLDDD